MSASEQSIQLLEENEEDMKKQEKLAGQVFNIERLLKKYKSNLNIVNQRIRVNIHKIVQSQREMIKRRTHKERFSLICQQMGKMVRGDNYW